MNLADFIIVKAGVMDILLGARDVPEVSTDQFGQLVMLCLQTHAWCVREELEENMLRAIAHANGNPITKDVLDGLLAVAQQERLDHATKLSAFATSLLSNFSKH